MIIFATLNKALNKKEKKNPTFYYLCRNNLYINKTFLSTST